MDHPLFEQVTAANTPAHAGRKAKITIWLDADVLAALKAQASTRGIGYQTLINDVLRCAIDVQSADPFSTNNTLDRSCPLR